MIHLFIDTNRYLSLFGLDESELKDIRIIKKYIDDKKITLWLPEQVKNEVIRNIESEILMPKFNKKFSEIKKLLNKNYNSKLPKLPECESELETINKILKEKASKINSIIEEIKNKIKNKIKEEANLPNKIVHELFSVAKFIPYDDKVIDKAFIRKKLRNPPGKKGSYGDSVIWETLLQEFPEGDALYFVGFDNDFASKLDNKKFSSFLIDEWKKKKKSDIIYFKHIGDFIKKNIPEIKSSDKIIEEEGKVDNEYLLTSDAATIALRNFAAHSVAMRESIRQSLLPMEAMRESIQQSLAPVEAMRESIRQSLLSMEAIRESLKQIYVPFYVSKKEIDKKDDVQDKSKDESS